VQLVVQAGAIGWDGEVLVLDIGTPVRVTEVAERLASQAQRPIDIVFTGLRPGEKLHEVLTSDTEEGTTRGHPHPGAHRGDPRGGPAVGRPRGGGCPAARPVHLRPPGQFRAAQARVDRGAASVSAETSAPDKVVVVGQGYVGPPVAMRAVEVGFDVRQPQGGVPEGCPPGEGKQLSVPRLRPAPTERWSLASPKAAHGEEK
jgi:hypothetical protein